MRATSAGLLYQNHLFRLRSLEVDPVFSEAWFNSAYAERYWRATCSTSSGLNTINSKQLRAMLFAAPRPWEQQVISQIAGKHQDRLDAENRTRDTLSAVRLGLMTDLLTGRVRVPIEAAP